MQFFLCTKNLNSLHRPGKDLEKSWIFALAQEEPCSIVAILV